MLSFIKIDKPPYCWIINQAQLKFLEKYFINHESFLYECARDNILKDNNVRTIFTITLPEETLLVKRYKIKGLWEQFKATFFSKARREIKLASYLIKNHLSTVYPFGVMEKKRFGFVTDVFVLLRRLDNVIPLNEFHASGVIPRREKNILLRSLSDLIEKLHKARFFHKDLHVGNILIDRLSLQTETSLLYIIDLHRSSALPYITQSHIIYNLAQMSYSLSTALPLTDVCRFIKYYRRLDFRGKLFKRFARVIFEEARNIRLRHWHSRNKRCLKQSSEYGVIKLSNETTEYSIFYQKSEVRNLKSEITEMISEHKKIALQEPKKLFKNTPRRKISTLSFDNRKVFVKEYIFSFANKIMSVFGVNPVRREWFCANGLKVRKIPTPEPIALVEERDPFFRLVRKGYLITQQIDAEQTNSYLVANFCRYIRDRKTFEYKVRFIKEFALAIKHLHQKRIFHADLKANNILISSASPVLFYFLDLDRVRFSQEVLLEERIKNLAQLNASSSEVMTRADRLRFYRFYSSGEKEMHPEKERMLIKKIMSATIKRHHFWPPTLRT
ncbi:MAG: lipopolysaccharide kinase InaA family protein [Planctomycetota bacterium]|nr:lipopolysaccharide kinase InaA family protein [Planctomycetota bacterium]